MYPIQFVSLGPGDPELITIKGLKALQAADWIFCPETITREGQILSRAVDIMQHLNIPEKHFCRFRLPMDKQRESALHIYEKVYSEAVQLYEKKKKICIVAEGDAGFYSSIHYIFEKLQSNNIPVVQIAGIPAFIASGALGGLHIASQEERLTILPGTTTTEEIENLISKRNVIVIMKLSKCRDEIRRCIQLHPEYNYHYFENVGTSDEVYLNDSKQIEAIHFPYFSLLIIRSDKHQSCF